MPPFISYSPRRGRVRLTLLCALCCLSIGILIFSAARAAGPAAEQPFTPPPFDPAALTGFPAVPERLAFSPALIEQGYRFYLCGVLRSEGREAEVYFTSPETNEVWLSLRMTDPGGNLLGASGVIRPGEYVRSVVLERTPDADAPVTLKIIAYQPETYVSMGAVSLNTSLHKKP